MIPEQIKALIEQGESESLELKKSLKQLKPAIETLCGFLNKKGGTIIIGVTQEGKPVGQTITDSTQREIANEISKIEPFPTHTDIQYITLDKQKNLKIIIISCNKGTLAPYTYDGRSFYRNQSSTNRMSQSTYAQLLFERSHQLQNSWETHRVENATLDDLDQREIRHTINVAVNINRIDPAALGEPLQDVLLRLELIREGKLTNAAMVLFSKSVIPDFSQCSIKMAHFRGDTELSGFIDNQTAHGNAFEIMQAANKFITRHLSVASFFNDSKLERIDKPTLPVLAIREALSNAICHRDYSIQNAAITLAIFSDRMEIWNNGTLPSYLSIADLKKPHKSYPRNKNIACIFYLRRYVETWGTGTTKMIQLCHKNGIPAPEFNQYSGGFSVTFYFQKTAPKTGDIPKSMTSLTKRQQAILALIEEHHSMKMADILAKIDNPPSDRTIRKDLNVLRQQKLIKLNGHGKNAVWVLVHVTKHLKNS